MFMRHVSWYGCNELSNLSVNQSQIIFICLLYQLYNKQYYGSANQWPRN